MTVGIIGSGNIAWHLLKALEEKGVRITDLYARDLKKAKALSGYTYDVNLKNDLDFSDSPSLIFIIAVSDDAIMEVANQLILPVNSILVHTSGAKGMIDLTVALDKNPTVKFGVFYPLMTFTKGVPVNFETVPFCIEAEDANTFETLATLAQKIARQVKSINSHQRGILHLAAVYGANFVNHLLALSKAIVEEEDLDFELLKPLFKESFRKAMNSEHPARQQTGPAIRRDFQTLALHEKMIEDDEDLFKVYRTLSNSIRDWNL